MLESDLINCYQQKNTFNHTLHPLVVILKKTVFFVKTFHPALHQFTKNHRLHQFGSSYSEKKTDQAWQLNHRYVANELPISTELGNVGRPWSSSPAFQRRKIADPKMLEGEIKAGGKNGYIYIYRYIVYVSGGRQQNRKEWWKMIDANWLDSRFCNPRRDLWNIENFKLSQKKILSEW